jgi:TRAP-type C4-dicarboxylate transport system substrate-binding protein
MDLRPPKYIVSSVPIRTLADVKGVTCRFSGETNKKLWAAAGGTPMYVDMPEIYEALDRGVIQATTGDVAIMRDFAWQEVAKYYQDIAFGSYCGPLAINLDALNSIPEGDREIFLEIMAGQGAREVAAHGAIFEEYKAILEGEGVEFIHFPDADMETWKNMPETKQIIGDWADEMDAKGLAGTEVMNTWLELLGLPPL